MIVASKETPETASTSEWHSVAGGSHPLPRLRGLSPFQRVLLITDGTVTDILEAYLAERMQVVKLGQQTRVWSERIPQLAAEPNARVLLRRILLRGERSGCNYIFAESLLLPDRLSSRVRESLEFTKKPLGQIMLEAQLETRREVLSWVIEPAGELASFFAIGRRAALVSRTYRVIAGRQPVMLITEKFPRAAFRSA